MKAQIKCILFIVVMLAVAVSCDTSSNVEPLYKKHFVKLFGGDGDNEAKDLIVNADNTFVLLGSSVLQDGSRKNYVLKTDSEGNVLWEKRFGDGFEYPQDIEPTATGYIILSNIDIGNDQYQFKLIQIDNDGNKGDTLLFDLFSDQFGHSITQLSDGGFYVTGNTSAIGSNANLPPGVTDLKDLLFVRFDATLSPVDTTRVGGSPSGMAVKVFETSPERFMSAEYSDLLWDQNPSYETNFCFRNFNFDPSSTSGDYTIIGDNVRQEFMSQTISSSGGSFFSIGTSVGSLTSSTIFITKTRSSSTGSPMKIFQNNIGSGRMEGVSIFPSGAFCYILSNTISEADGTRDIWLTRVNAFTGDQDSEWASGFTFGTSTNDDTGKVVAESPSGDIVILGTMNLTNQKKIALIKLSADAKFNP
jgi:hypothetical protein